jgi:branched-chain amino acid transport system permease protein
MSNAVDQSSRDNAIFVDTSLAPPKSRSYLLIGAIFAIALLFPLYFQERFAQHVAILFFLYTIGALGVHLIIRCGLVSLCQAAFMGVGGYVSVLLDMKLGVPWALSAVSGVAASCLLAVAIGPVVMRLSGKYFVLVTFLFGEIARMGFAEWVSLTGGANGVANIPPPAPIFLSTFYYYYLALGFLVLTVAIAALVLNSQIGRVVSSIREGERLAECSGVPVLRFKVIIFVIACGFNGLQGVLHAHYVRYIEPITYGVLESLNMAVANILGGMTSLVGPFIGTVFVVVLPEFLRGTVLYQKVIFGILLIIVMAVAPGGMIEIGSRVVSYIRRRAQP